MEPQKFHRVKIYASSKILPRRGLFILVSKVIPENAMYPLTWVRRVICFGDNKPGMLFNWVYDDFCNKFGIQPRTREEKVKEVTLEKLHYCMSALRPFQAADEETRLFKSPAYKRLNHDYIVVEFRLPGVDALFYMLAEKIGSSGLMSKSRKPAESDGGETQGGIYIYLLDAQDSAWFASDGQKNIFWTVPCSAVVNLRDVTSQLEDHNLDYHPLRKGYNCWDYAKASFRKVLAVAADANNLGWLSKIALRCASRVTSFYVPLNKTHMS
ncbi:hypothetical protein R1sor_020072 [Riccia sorocarpa]|uniref:LAGLIDADG homing endonuclease n=1 Tax=Riccia sorocarpa TaxID=122646 RepID=A0ABD3II43_9MARC